MDKNIETFVKEFNKANKIVFLTGAGVSTDSGIPDYRGTNGLYLKNPKYMLSRECWRREYLKFLQFVTDKFSLDEFKPNSIHLWIAELEKTKNTTVITQNIDHLHQNAGSTNVITYHGDMNSWHCTGTDECLDHNKVYDLNYVKNHNYCSCGAKLSPDVVLYGDNIDTKKDADAVKAIREADIVICMGTSLAVFPFASLIEETIDKFTVLVNNTPTDNYFNCFDLKFMMSINDFLNKVDEKLKKDNIDE